ncbi:MAG: hypothetical protein JOZ62_13340 [Acidobacteriaceae bacterium]|nr:hypothetical protein [Acidobacteriaceae bacterium]
MRRQVIGFYAYMLLILVMTLGSDHHGFRHFTYATSPIFIALLVCWRWSQGQQFPHVRAYEAAGRFLGRALPWLAGAYWAVYLWMPAGGWREALMDSPVLLSWLVIFVVSLPLVIEMWTEPDGIGESTVLASGTGYEIR